MTAPLQTYNVFHAPDAIQAQLLKEALETAAYTIDQLTKYTDNDTETC